MIDNLFDDISIQDNVLSMWKSMGEGSGFTIIIREGKTELWETTQYGCNEYSHTVWDFFNVEEAYTLGKTFT